MTTTNHTSPGGEKLQRCPMCGSTASHDNDVVHCWIICDECKLSTPGFRSGSQAATAWNRRAAHGAGAQEKQAIDWRHSLIGELGCPEDLSDEAVLERVAVLVQQSRSAKPMTDAPRDVQDAKRYRLLRERHFVRADNPNVPAYHCVGVFTSWLPAPKIDREGLDAVLDAEIERIERAGRNP